MKLTGTVLVAALLWAGAPEGPQSKPATPEPSDKTKTLYAVQCQACHGPDGKALLPDMSFVDRAWKHGTKTSDMAEVIANGVPGTMMMPFKGRLTDAQIRELAAYVRSLDPKLKPEKK